MKASTAGCIDDVQEKHEQACTLCQAFYCAKDEQPSIRASPPLEGDPETRVFITP
jgi:hypothetical protein